MKEFFVAGIGTSAGGLEALQTLFAYLQPSDNLCVVIIQHLSSEFESRLDELLASHTKFPVHKVTENLQIHPGHVYIIPSQHNLLLEEDQLKLVDKPPRHTVNLPIDLFLSSLSRSYGSNAIGVIFTGTGTDGSRGIRDIHEQGGIVMVQSPNDAKFDGMPNAALATNITDYHGTIPEIAKKINAISSQSIEKGFQRDNEKYDIFSEILKLVNKETNNNYYFYRKSTLLRRIHKRMALLNLGNIEDYYMELKENNREVIHLGENFLIGVSSFFRDKEVWDYVKEQVVPQIFSRSRHKTTVRVWVAACATGEEAYTVGMLLQEYLDQHDLDVEYKIFATDIDRKSLQHAGQGYYPQDIRATLSEERIERFFDRTETGYKVKKFLRENIVFAYHNMIVNPPFIDMDMISCRNALIYIESEYQQKVLKNFLFSLGEGKNLLIGKSEDLGPLKEKFRKLTPKINIFESLGKEVRLDNLTESNRTLQPNEQSEKESDPLQRNFKVADPFLSHLANEFSPDIIFVNSKLEIEYLHRNANEYLQLPKKRLSQSLMAMIQGEGLSALKSGINQVLESEKKIIFKDFTLYRNQRKVNVRIALQKVTIKGKNLARIDISPNQEEHQDMEEVMVETKSTEISNHVRVIEQELEHRDRQLVEMREQLESSHEELQASNEELLSSNEELQSSNEELQSVNEELFSVNTELEEKIEELTKAHTDINNLLESTQIATIFLDNEMKIRFMNPSAADIVNFSTQDLGRSIYHFSTKLKFNLLYDDLAKVIRDGKVLEREEEGEDGRIYLNRNFPYLNSDGAQDGVVITFVDITDIKMAREEIKDARDYAENIINTVNESLVVLDDHYHLQSANPRFFNRFKLQRQESTGINIFSLLDEAWDRDELKQKMDEVTGSHKKILEYPLEYTDAAGNFWSFKLNIIKIKNSPEGKRLVLLTIRDVTEQKKAENQIRETNEKIRILLESSQVGMWELDIKNGKVTWDERSAEIFDYKDHPFDHQIESVFKRIHQQDLPTVNRAVEESVKDQKPYKEEYRVVREDGSITYTVAYGFVLTDEEGNPTKMLGTNYDYTDLRRSEEKLNRLGQVVEDSYSEVYIFDAITLKFIDVNLGARNNLGYSMEELFQMTPIDLKPEFTKELFLEMVSPLLEEEKDKISFETVHQRKDLSSYNVLVNLQISHYDEQPVFIANIQDITNLIEAREKLQLSEERLEYAVQGTADGVWDWQDLNNDEVWWSPRFYELLGLEDQQIKGSMKNLIKLIHPEDRKLYNDTLSLRMQEEGTHEVEFRALHKKTGYRWYLSRGQAFRNEQGNAIRMAGAMSDIQDRKKAEIQYTHTYEMLKRANEYLDDIVFTVAHDLRSPVANLKSLVELFKSRNEESDPIVNRIDLSVERLEQTLRGLIQILDVHQSEDKLVSVISISDILRELQDELFEKIEEAETTIEISLDVKQIRYIPTFMESILKQLLANAIKYRKPNTPAKVAISTEYYREYVLLKVEDNGVGIDLERYSKKLFKPFERISNTSTGQGIGLHLIKTIVEKNGGKIRATSQLDVGTTFKVYLKPYA